MNTVASHTEPSVEMTEAGTSNESNRNHHEPATSFLYSLAKRWAWEAVAFRCDSNPDEASSKYRDSNGDTLLHWTCFGSPPAHVVKALLKACPDLATVPNNDGCLPLHVACSYRASSEVIRNLVQHYPESVGVPNKAGSYAIHILCDYGCSVESMKTVLETPGSASAVVERDNHFRRTPLQILNERKNLHEFYHSLDELRRYRTTQSLLCIRSNPEILCRDELDEKCTVVERLNEMPFFQKAKMLIRAEHLGRSIKTVDLKILNMVHACIAIEQSCPPSILEFMVLLRPEELLLKDTNGQLPLHIAAAVSDESTLCDVLAGDLNAARVLDQSGQLALQIYLQRIPDACWSGALEPLVLANPLALEALDLDTRFYPLIWAKMAVKKKLDALFKTIRGNASLFL